MKQLISLVLLLASCASQAATLIINTTRVNHNNGDRVQYRLPNQSWITLVPAYGQSKVYGVPNNVIVVARVFNVQQNRTISVQAKATMKKPIGDADSGGNVYFQLFGTG